MLGEHLTATLQKGTHINTLTILRGAFHPCLIDALEPTYRFDSSSGREQNPGPLSSVSALQSSKEWRSGVAAALDRIYKGVMVSSSPRFFLPPVLPPRLQQSPPFPPVPLLVFTTTVVHKGFFSSTGFWKHNCNQSRKGQNNGAGAAGF